jgi:signal transduction histidine kinase/ActR/RegA family two-component response regulator
MFVLPQQRLKLFPRIIAIVVLALIYYGMAEIARHTATTPQSVTPIWPPDGFASAAVLIFGYQILAGVFLGSFLSNIWAFYNADSWYTASISVLIVVGIAIGTTLGTGVGKYLLNRQIRQRNPFRKLNDVYQFLLLTGTVAPMINATFGAVCLVLGGKISWSVFVITWLTWWISNAAGICIFTPALISWYEFYCNQERRNLITDWQFQVKQVNPWRIVEAISLVLIVLTTSFLSFFQEYHLEYVLIPCLVWTVLRFGQLGATNLIVIITMIAVVGTARGEGAFSIHNSKHSLILLQFFIVFIVLTTFSLLAVLTEKKQAIDTLQISRKKLIEKSIQLEDSQSVLNQTALVLENQNIELSEAKQLAEKANLAKTEFLSNMSHELRTPLNAILGLIHLLHDSPNLNDQEKVDIQTAYQSSTHLLYLIDDILDIAKIEAGKLELHLQDVYLSKLFKELKQIIQVQATQKGIDFICDFDPNLPPVIKADGKRLKQILLNLLSNAIKFTPKGKVKLRVNVVTPIATEALTSQVSIKFEVKDSGIGISEDKLAAIFLPFEQTGETRFKVQGTGLGLAISQRIAAMMGSQITVASKYGIGSIFGFTVCFEVPQNQFLYNYQNTAATSTDDITGFDLTLAQKMPLNILVADDNIVNQKVARKILSRLGYEADVVSSGVEVLEAIKRRFYNVILMDVQMPEMDGLETTQHIIKEQLLDKRPYIIALTANAMDSDRIDCLAAGMDDYISKPINVSLLVGALLRSQQNKASF